MKSIAVIGAGGFVGSTICKYINTLNEVKLVPVFRSENYEEKLKDSNYIIHCANSPSRYKATQDPIYDYYECVKKTYDFSELAKKTNAKFVLISSMSAATQLDQVYGLNRASAELIARKDNALIIRLGYMFSKKRTYGALNDIINNDDVYLDGNSEYSFSDVGWNAKKIVDLTLENRSGIFELGSSGSITLKEIVEILGSTSSFKFAYKDIQIAKNIFEDSPSIEDFREYLRGLR